jgi:hypothetical protein
MTAAALETKPVPQSHLDLLTDPIVAVLTTLMPSGQPHSCLVWVDYDGDCARLNTTLERQSGRNLLSDRRLSLLIADPENTARYIHIRGARSSFVGALSTIWTPSPGTTPAIRASTATRIRWRSACARPA